MSYSQATSRYFLHQELQLLMSVYTAHRQTTPHHSIRWIHELVKQSKTSHSNARQNISTALTVLTNGTTTERTQENLMSGWKRRSTDRSGNCNLWTPSSQQVSCRSPIGDVSVHVITPACVESMLHFTWNNADLTFRSRIYIFLSSIRLPGSIYNFFTLLICLQFAATVLLVIKGDFRCFFSMNFLSK